MGFWRSGLLVLAVLGLSGCAATPPVPADARPAAIERFGAPLVTRPADVTSIYGDPCRQLSTAELSTLGITKAGARRSYLGDSECRWGSRAGDSLLMSIHRDRDLLVDTYRARLLPIFEPGQVAGYPSVRQQTARENNICTVTIGLGPKQALEADWTGLGTLKPGDPDPCERAETAAALVIRKLPPQS
ncbi:DUF3558 domain-containing protein [Actinomycetospora chiangmaiensis]|uniref:DUF3558 domain-containing protein n=1 Tax=Actinomycetospora chiangmaiensis TaxID=402650 RepID=UPI0012F98E35|nr:DUF3558 domain-containing protein [Actinomycetospora chiangmaiensis]